MILLRLLSWQYARKHPLRSVMTTVGIVLGVGIFVGMHTANTSVLGGFPSHHRPHRRHDSTADFGGGKRI